MNLLREAPLWAQLLLAALLLGAAAQDIVHRRISNWWCVSVMITAAAAAIATGPTHALWQNALIFALLLGVGIPLFSAGWLGGGDVKLFAALGLWANIASIMALVACILIAGGLLAALSLAVRGGRAARGSKGVPYGVAIAVGAFVVLLQPKMFEASGPRSLSDLRTAREGPQSSDRLNQP